jgi:hypothetical protein
VARKLPALPSETLRKLAQKIGDPPLDKYRGKDVAMILKEVSTRARLQIECGQAVLRMPPAMRVWTGHVGRDTRLLTFLQEDLPAWKALAWVYLDGRIIVTTPQEAERLKPGIPMTDAPPREPRVNQSEEPTRAGTEPPA